MPSVRKLSPEEVEVFENKGKGQRKIIEEQYDGILSEYSAGDYGEAILESAENRLTVRNRFKAASRRRGLSIIFRRSKEDVLRFQVVGAESAAAADVPPAAEAPKARGRKKSSS